MITNLLANFQQKKVCKKLDQTKMIQLGKFWYKIGKWSIAQQQLFKLMDIKATKIHSVTSNQEINKNELTDNDISHVCN